VTGEVVEVNADLTDHPEQVNEDCYGDGWMIAVVVSDGSTLGASRRSDLPRHVEERGQE